MASSTPRPLLSIRTALIFMIALVFGVIAGFLTVATGQPLSVAVLVGLGVAGSTIVGLHKLIAF